MKEMFTESVSNDLDEIKVEEVESEMILLGATGVEDALQENVKDCIIDFREAGMKVWMLTGDNGLTAREISLSSGVIDPEDAVLEIEEDIDHENIEKILDENQHKE
jgi:magnesium-transporting ATPase (P-type)